LHHRLWRRLLVPAAFFAAAKRIFAPLVRAAFCAAAERDAALRRLAARLACFIGIFAGGMREDPRSPGVQRTAAALPRNESSSGAAATARGGRFAASSGENSALTKQGLLLIQSRPLPVHPKERKTMKRAFAPAGQLTTKDSRRQDGLAEVAAEFEMDEDRRGAHEGE
jgi:hypothetical protein